VEYKVTTRKRVTWSYQIYIKRSGSWKYHSSGSGFKTQRKAEETGHKLSREIQTQPEASQDCFKAIAEKYIKDGLKEPSTLKAYKSWLEVYKPIHNTPITEVTYSDVSQIITDYYRDHKYLGTKSILNFGASIFRYAIKKIKIKMENPFDDIVIREKNNKAKKTHIILTMQAMTDFFNSIEDNELRLLCMLCGYGGMRISEARGITTADIDLKHNTVRVAKQYNKEFGEKSITKSKNSDRTIPLHPLLKKEIIQQPAQIDKKRRLIESNLTTKDIKALYPGMMAHSLRHSFATSMIEQGMDFKTLAYIMGDTVEMIVHTYSHVNSNMMDNAKKIIQNL